MKMELWMVLVSILVLEQGLHIKSIGAGDTVSNEIYPPESIPSHVDDNTTHIYIGLIVSFGGAFNSSANVPGVRDAVDRINNDTSILENYTLHYVLSDSQVSLFNKKA